MFTTSLDILYLVISFCVLLVTFFLCYTFYHFSRLLRNVNEIIEEFRLRLETLLETVNYIRGKVENLSSIMTLFADGASGLAKKMILKKANSWLDDKSEKFNESAKAAVEKAVQETARKMKKTTKTMKK